MRMNGFSSGSSTIDPANFSRDWCPATSVTPTAKRSGRVNLERAADDVRRAFDRVEPHVLLLAAGEANVNEPCDSGRLLSAQTCTRVPARPAIPPSGMTP